MCVGMPLTFTSPELTTSTSPYSPSPFAPWQRRWSNSFNDEGIRGGIVVCNKMDEYLIGTSSPHSSTYQYVWQVHVLEQSPALDIRNNL